MLLRLLLYKFTKYMQIDIKLEIEYKLYLKTYNLIYSLRKDSNKRV